MLYLHYRTYAVSKFVVCYAGPCEEPAESYRDLLHPGDGGLRAHQCRLLHHAQRTRGPRLRGRGSGMFTQ